MKRVLVLGQTGLLARALIRSCPPGFDVTCIGRGDLGALPSAHGMRALISDLRPDVILNAMGIKNGRPDELDQINCGLVAAALEAAAQASARFVTVGSAAEYGGGPFFEGAPCHPASHYGESKLRATEAVLAARAAGADAGCARLFNLFCSPPPVGSPLEEFAARILMSDKRETARVEVRNGHTERDFISLADAAAGIWGLAVAPEIPPVVNICSGTGVRYSDLIQSLARRARRSIRLVDLQEPTAPLRVVGDTTLMAETLGPPVAVSADLIAESLVPDPFESGVS